MKITIDVDLEVIRFLIEIDSFCEKILGCSKDGENAIRRLYGQEYVDMLKLPYHRSDQSKRLKYLLSSTIGQRMIFVESYWIHSPRLRGYKNYY